MSTHVRNEWYPLSILSATAGAVVFSSNSFVLENLNNGWVMLEVLLDLNGIEELKSVVLSVDISAIASACRVTSMTPHTLPNKMDFNGDDEVQFSPLVFAPTADHITCYTFPFLPGRRYHISVALPFKRTK